MGGTKTPTDNWLMTVLTSQWNRLLVGPGMALSASLIPPLAVKVPAAIAGFALTAGGNLLSNRRVRIIEERFKRQDVGRVIEHTLLVAARFIEASQGSTDRTLRANVMLLDRDLALRVTYQSEPGEDNEHLRWRRGQGCVGRVLETGKTVIGDELLPVTIADADKKHRPWNMSPEQIRHTAERIGSILSIPLRLPEGRRVVGVLNFDDPKPVTESLLNRPDIIETAELVAKGLGPYLAELGITEETESGS